MTSTDKCYCLVKKSDSVAYIQVHNNMEFSVQLIFRPQLQGIIKLIGTSDGGELVEARRLSTVSYKEGGGSSECFKTQWRWYWRDDHNRWQLFESVSKYCVEDKKYFLLSCFLKWAYSCV